MGTAPQRIFEKLARVSGLELHRDDLLAPYTRFGLGGPASVVAITPDESAFREALNIARDSSLPYVVIGGGTNLIVSDAGFPGIVLKLTADRIEREETAVRVDAGAVLQTLVDFTVDHALEGLQTMTGIPGFTGAAIYGNAGAYGHSISEWIDTVRFLDGDSIREFSNQECQFQYRESIFKRQKEWIILSARLQMRSGDGIGLRETADRILAIRNKKYPPTMKCAGSIFKNYLLKELPDSVAAQVPAASIIEGKVPSAWFLDQVGAKGMNSGDIHVADYHANLIYNAGKGTARDLIRIVDELKRRVRERWNIPLEEEVQYVGFAERNAHEPLFAT